MEIVKIISVVCGLLPFAYIYFCWLFGLNDLLYDFLEKVFYAILSIGLFWKGLAIFINWCTSNNYDEDDYYAVELMKCSQAYVPTPQVVSNQKPTLETKESVKTDNPSESRGETEIIWERNGTGAVAHHLVRGSKEWQEQIARNAKQQREEEIAEIDRLRAEQNGERLKKFMAGKNGN